MEMLRNKRVSAASQKANGQVAPRAYEFGAQETFVIGVLNEGPIAFDPFYDGIHYHCDISRPGDKPHWNVFPWTVAREVFGLATDEAGNPITDAGGYVLRATQPANDREDEGLFSERLSSLCPKRFVNQDGSYPFDKALGLPGHYDDDPVFKDWFTNKLKFRLKKIPRQMSAEEFLRI